jgi:hypothetical protein
MGDAATLFSEIYEAMDGLKTELQAAKDRASTSYREGYEAGRAVGFKAGVQAEADARAAKETADLRERAAMDGQVRAVLATNPLDPKCATIFEAAEMIASVTAALRKVADALEKVSVSREQYRRDAWDADTALCDAREQLRLMTRERDEWCGEARALREARDLALERAERAEKLLEPNAERQRCAEICAALARMMEAGAGEGNPGDRLRQAERLIREGTAEDRRS